MKRNLANAIRMSKSEWYRHGGLAEVGYFRIQSKSGAWKYYRMLP